MSDFPHPFVTTDRVRWADVDLVGIMRFSAFTRLVENAEQELMRAAGLPYSGMFDPPEFFMPRRKLTVDYLAPARIDEALALSTYVSRLGDTSVTLNVDVMSGDCARMYASAEMVLVCVDAADFTKRSIPEVFREALTPFALDTVGARTWVNATMRVHG